MKDKKMIYKNREDWNEEEKKTGLASYATFIDKYIDNMVLCNDIVNIDDLELVCGADYDEERDEYADIFQYYIIDLSNWALNELQKKYQDNIIIYYCNTLGVYVLGVDHFGTSWDYVNTDIKLTDNWEDMEA